MNQVINRWVNESMKQWAKVVFHQLCYSCALQGCSWTCKMHRAGCAKRRIGLQKLQKPRYKWRLREEKWLREVSEEVADWRRSSTKKSSSLIHSSIHQSIHACIHPSIHPSVHPSTRSFVHSFLTSFLPSFIHSFIQSFIHSINHSYIHTFIHWFAESLVQWFSGSLVEWFIDSRSCEICLSSCNPTCQERRSITQALLAQPCQCVLSPRPIANPQSRRVARKSTNVRAALARGTRQFGALRTCHALTTLCENRTLATVCGALFVGSFCRWRPGHAETETLLRRPREPHSKKYMVSRPRAFSHVNSGIPESLHIPTVWMMGGWHDDVVDMMMWLTWWWLTWWREC